MYTHHLLIDFQREQMTAACEKDFFQDMVISLCGFNNVTMKGDSLLRESSRQYLGLLWNTKSPNSR